MRFSLIAVGTAKPLLESGKLIPVANFRLAQDSPPLPDLPGVELQGFRVARVDGPASVRWYAAGAREGLVQGGCPHSRDFPIAKGMRALNLIPIGGIPREFDMVFKNELAKWTHAVRELGLEIE